MSTLRDIPMNPKLDLLLERVVDVPRELVWKAWTVPEHLMPWFCPKPWSVSDCVIDLRPGGRFFTMMRSPEGDPFPNEGCYLEVTPNERLIWTDMLLADYRPVGKIAMGFTAIVTMKPEGAGTRYTAMALHRDEAGRSQHEAMGFYEGWGKCLEQLVEYAKGMK